MAGLPPAVMLHNMGYHRLSCCIAGQAQLQARLALASEGLHVVEEAWLVAVCEQYAPRRHLQAKEGEQLHAQPAQQPPWPPVTSAGDQCGCVLHAEAVCLQLRVTTVRACDADRRACAGMPGLHAQWHGVRLARIQHI